MSATTESDITRTVLCFTSYNSKHQQILLIKGLDTATKGWFELKKRTRNSNGYLVKFLREQFQNFKTLKTKFLFKPWFKNSNANANAS